MHGGVHMDLSYWKVILETVGNMVRKNTRDDRALSVDIKGM